MTTVLLVQKRGVRAFPAQASLRATGGSPFEVHRAESREEAVALLEQRVFDVAIIDLANDASAGARLVGTLRRMAPHLPVVLLAHRAQESLALRALALGARDYLIKRPGQSGLLPRVIRHAIELERGEHERERLLEALRVSTARTKSLFDHAVVGMAFATLGGQITDANAALRTILGYSQEELFAATPRTLCHPEDAALDWSFLDRLRDGTATSFEIERRFLHRDGRIVWGLAHLSVVQDHRGQPLQMVFELRDVSDRKRTQEALLTEQEESRLILETASDAFVSADGEGRILEWNARAELLFGWSREEAIGRALMETLVPERLRAAHLRAWNRFHGSRASAVINAGYRTTALHRDGREIPVELTLWHAQNGALNAFIRDLSERVRADAALRESEIRFRAVFEGSSIGILIRDPEGRIFATNPMLQQLLGYTAEELLGRSDTDLLHRDDIAAHRSMRRQLLLGKRETETCERRWVRKDGQLLAFRVTASVVRAADGRPEYLVEVMEDLRERREAEARLKATTLQLVELVADAASRASTADDVLQICLDHVCGRFGWPLGHVLLPSAGDPVELIPTEIWHIADAERFAAFRRCTMGLRHAPGDGLAGQTYAERRALWMTDLRTSPLFLRSTEALAAGIQGVISVPLLLGHEAIGVLQFFSTAPMKPDPAITEAVVEIARHIARVLERKRIDEMYAHQALHDALTDLPNRVLFVDRVGHALQRAKREGTRLALLFIDLDGFKDVNDSFGHEAGDSVLIAVAERLLHILRPGDTVARFGGDEFTVLCEGISGEDEARAIAQRLLEAFSEPLTLEDFVLAVTPSIGIALARPDQRPETLLRNADAAMYRAKEQGGANYYVFDEPLARRVSHRRGLEWRLRRAVDARQLRVLYQPGYSLRDGSVAGVEALVRWQHPERGLLDPREFIPLAEETGLVVPIGHWVFQEACRTRAQWGARFGDGAPELWVNLSSRQLSHIGIADKLTETIQANHLDPRQVTFEITESLLLDDDEAMAELRKLCDRGVGLSIDDFGTGYSSLTRLKRLPVSQIKLDRSFVQGLGRGRQDEAIVAGVIGMAHALGLSVVAEGVETAPQLERLQALGCDGAQGYYFAAPLTAEAMTDRIAVATAAAAA